MITCNLIALYESHMNLWDVSAENYKNRNLRKSSIEEILYAVGIPVQEINDKIHNLRCQFQNINRKRLKIRSGQTAGDNFKVKWEFYDALKFINRPTSSNNETVIDSMVRFLLFLLYSLSTRVCIAKQSHPLLENIV